MIANAFISVRQGDISIKNVLMSTFRNNLQGSTTQSHTKCNYALQRIQKNHSCTSFNTNLKPPHVCCKGGDLNARKEFEMYKAYDDV